MGENEEHTMPRAVTPSCKKKSKFVGDSDGIRVEYGGYNREDAIVDSAGSGRSHPDEQNYRMSDASITSPLIITPYHSDLFRRDHELQQSLLDFRRKLGLSLDAILQKLSFVSSDSVYKELAKQVCFRYISKSIAVLISISDGKLPVDLGKL